MSLLWLILFASLLHRADPVCQFQNPFYFIDRPSVVTVVDSSGQMVADRSERIIRDVNMMTMKKRTYNVSYCRVRVSWGRVQNFKCVDYFQIEYYTEEDPEGSFAVSEIINRHRTSHDITIAPCRYLRQQRLVFSEKNHHHHVRNYLFKIIASEDWRGVRQDYKVGSDQIKFKVDYAPR